MIPRLLAKKVGMTQLFGDDGSITPVTILECGPCTTLQLKTTKSDGYNAVQLGFADGKKKSSTKALMGHFKKSKTDTPKRFIKEIRLPDGQEGEKIVGQIKLGDQIKSDIFEGTWKINVIGITKGRGFAGTIKMWNQQRGPTSHGSMNVRMSGSIGSDTRLTHIRPGKHMPGHYGVERRTAKNLELMKIDKQQNLLFVKGSIPGAMGKYVIVEKTNLVKPAPKPEGKGKKKISRGGKK